MIDKDAVPQLAGESTARMIPFAEHVRFKADTGEVEFEESSDLSIAVAERVLPSWARAARLTCVRVAGESMEPTDGGLVVVDQDRRVAVGDQWNLVSDRLAHLPRPMTADDRIVGRVAWCGPHGAAVA